MSDLPRVCASLNPLSIPFTIKLFYRSHKNPLYRLPFDTSDMTHLLGHSDPLACHANIQPMRFAKLSVDERARAEELLAAYRVRPKNKDASFRSLCGAAARQAKHGNAPNYRQRAAYRMHKKRRARLTAAVLYGDPLALVPIPRA